MRLVFHDGRPVALAACCCHLASELEKRLLVYYTRHSMHRILLDFASERIPVSKPNLAFACTLACAYHNSNVRENVQDRTYGPVEAGNEGANEGANESANEAANKAANEAANDCDDAIAPSKHPRNTFPISIAYFGRRALYFLGDWRPRSGPGGTTGGALIGTV